MAASFCFNLCRCCMAHGFSTKLTSVFENGGKQADSIKKLLGVDVMVDKDKFDALICQPCADKLEELLEFQSKASFASEMYFKRTRDACEQIKVATAKESSGALNTATQHKTTIAVPDNSFGVSIKQERQDDSSEVPFVTRIPLENVKKELPSWSPSDFITPQKNVKKRKLEEDEPKQAPKQNKSKKSQNVACEFCDAVLTRQNLKRHLDRFHKKHKCGFCKETFHDVQEYRKHNLSAHRDIFDEYLRRHNATDLMQVLDQKIGGLTSEP